MGISGKMRQAVHRVAQKYRDRENARTMRRAFEEALARVAARGLLNTGGVAVVESDRPFTAQFDALVRYDERRYGRSYLTFYSPE